MATDASTTAIVTRFSFPTMLNRQNNLNLLNPLNLLRNKRFFIRKRSRPTWRVLGPPAAGAAHA